MKYIISKNQYNQLIENKQKKKTIAELSMKVKNINENVKNKSMAHKLKKELIEQYLKNNLILQEDIPKKLI